MGVTYDKCDEEVTDLIAKVLADHHRELDDAGVTVSAMFAIPSKDKNGDDAGPAVKVNGWPRAAKIKKTTLEQRAKGLADAEITIDQSVWETLSEEQRVALIDHEITHLALCIDENGGVKTDDCRRPKLKMRLHDWRVEGFAEVVKRHGVDALETQSAKQFRDQYGQLLMWAEDPAAVG